MLNIYKQWYMNLQDELHNAKLRVLCFIRNKSLGGFHLARQNLIELTGLDLMRIVMIRQ